MTRVEWLKSKHLEVSRIVDQLESERSHNRSSEHKALLQLLKKEKLRYKSELHSLERELDTTA